MPKIIIFVELEFAEMNSRNTLSFGESFMVTDKYKKSEKILDTVILNGNLHTESTTRQTWITVYSSKLESLKNIEFYCQATIEFIKSTKKVMDGVAKIIEKTNGFTCETTNIYLETTAIKISDWLGEWLTHSESGLREIIADDVTCNNLIDLYKSNLDTDNLCKEVFDSAIGAFSAIRSFTYSWAMQLIENALYDHSMDDYSLCNVQSNNDIKDIEFHIITLNALRTPTHFVDYKLYKTTNGTHIDHLGDLFKNGFLNEIIDIAGEQKDYAANFQQRNILKKLIRTPIEFRIFFGDDKDDNFADKLALEFKQISEKSIELLEHICFRYFCMILLYSVLTITVVETQEVFYNAFTKYIDNAIDSYLVTTYKIQNDTIMNKERQKHFPLLTRFTASISRNSQGIALNAFLKTIDKAEPGTIAEIFRYLADLDTSMRGSSSGKLLEELATIKINIIELIVDAIDHESPDKNEVADVKKRIQKCFDDVFDDFKSRPNNIPKNDDYVSINTSLNEYNIFENYYNQGQYAISTSIYNETTDYDTGVLFLLSNITNTFEFIKID